MSSLRFMLYYSSPEPHGVTKFAMIPFVVLATFAHTLDYIPPLLVVSIVSYYMEWDACWFQYMEASWLFVNLVEYVCSIQCQFQILILDAPMEALLKFPQFNNWQSKYDPWIEYERAQNSNDSKFKWGLKDPRLIQGLKN